MPCSLFFKWQLEYFLLGEVSPGVQSVGGDETRWYTQAPGRCAVVLTLPCDPPLKLLFISTETHMFDVTHEQCYMEVLLRHTETSHQTCAHRWQHGGHHCGAQGSGRQPDSGGAGLCVFGTHLALHRCFLEPWSQCVSDPQAQGCLL